MKFKFIVVIILVILGVIFALQNAEIVLVQLWFWETTISLALLIFLCIAVGIIIGLIAPSLGIKENEEEND